MAKEKGYTKRVETSATGTAERTIQTKDVETDLLFGKKITFIFYQVLD